MSSHSSKLPLGVEKGTVRDLLEVIYVGVLLILFFKTFVAQQFVIPSGSMRSTLMIGDHLLTNKFIYASPQWDWERSLFPMRNVKRGDIIAFRYPMDRNSDYVKRCVALPGDRVEIKDKRLYLNGRLVTGVFEYHVPQNVDGPVPGPWPLGRDAGASQRYQLKDAAERSGALPPLPKPWPFDPETYPESVNMDRQGQTPLGRDAQELFTFRDDIPPFTIPPGQVLAMGDNRDDSEDSRYWGFVPMDHLRGRPFLVWWSYREFGRDDENARTPTGPQGVAMNFLDTIQHFATWTRWERTGTIPR